jgi:hypothetical protein
MWPSACDLDFMAGITDERTLGSVLKITLESERLESWLKPAKEMNKPAASNSNFVFMV